MGGSVETFRRVARDSGTAWALALAIDRVLPFGAVRLWAPRVVPPARLGEQIALILRSWGMSEEHTALTVEKILYADLRGIDSHGCCMLPFYAEQRAAGLLNPAPEVAVVQESATTALVDGGGGLGHVPATRAMAIAIEKSRAEGVGVVAVRNSGHYGAAGAYAAMAAEAGRIGVATTSTPTPSVVPTFARKALLGTNPIAIAAPARRNRPFLLDMATSTASLGKLVERWRSGRSIPRGWAVDERGRPLTNGREAAERRRLTPLGGDREHGSHKGYGLATAVEILSALLPGVAFPERAGERRERVGHFFLALDPGRFRPAAAFGDDLDRLIDALHAAEPVAAERPVLVPGDPEEEILARRRADGIPLAKGVFEDLRSVARGSGVPFVLEEGGA